MNKLALALASAVFALSIPQTANATVETPEAREQASDAAYQARQDLYERFGEDFLKPNSYVWDADGIEPGEVQVVISLSDQMAYAYRSGVLIGAASVSTAKEGMITPTGIFPVLEKKPMHRIRKYNNAPMPYMQRLDNYGIAMHAGHNPGEPASHGCIRLPAKFAAKLYGITDVGSQVLIAA